MKKLALLLVLAMCLGMLGAVAVADGNFNETGFPIVKETETFTFFTPHNTAVEDYFTNTFVTGYEAMTNVHIDWQLVPPSGLTEKKNLLFNSGATLPDAFFGAGISTSEAVRYGDMGLLMPIDDLIEKYNPEMQKMLAQVPGARDLMRTPSGKTYQFPSISHCYHCFYPHKYWVNTKWLENLQLSVPTTTDEFYDMLVAFRDKDPNQNGLQDEIPMTAAQTSWSSWPRYWIMNAFVYEDPYNHIFVKDEKISFTPADPRYKEGLAFLAKLYAEGLMDKEAYTQDMEMMVQKFKNQDIAIVGGAPCMHYLALVGVDGDRPNEYDVLPPLKGPEGYASTYYSPVGMDLGKFVISADCKKPEVLARWIDYFYTEEGLLSQKYGVENQEWYHPAADSGQMGHGEGLDPAPARFNWMPGKAWTETLQNVTLNQQGPIWEPRSFRGAWTSDPASPLEPRLVAATKKYEGFEQTERYDGLIMLTLEETEEIAPLQEQLFRYVDEFAANVITGKANLDAEWDNYLSELKNLGVDRFVEIRQGAYNRYLGK